MSSTIFDPEASQEVYNFWLRSPAPEKCYTIFFTPRSGSSWLTSILSKTKIMGTPGERFNPNFMPSSTRAKGARNLAQYIEAISRHEAHGGVFGFEITYHQLRRIFENDATFMDHFADSNFFWLIRRDIVSQGVSLDKMVQTQIGHAAQHGSDAIEKSDAIFTYDEERIRKWIIHIRNAEIGTEGLINHYKLSPKRLSYESMMDMGSQKVVNIFSEALGIDSSISEEISSEHRKIGTEKNSAFAERFRSESGEFVKRLEEERAEMLAKFP